MTQENKKPNGPAVTRNVADAGTNVPGGPLASDRRLAELATLTATRRNGPPRRRPNAHKKSSSSALVLLGLGAMVAAVTGIAVLELKPSWLSGLTPQSKSVVTTQGVVGGGPSLPPTQTQTQTQSASTTAVIGSGSGSAAPVGTQGKQSTQNPDGQNNVASSTLDWHNGPLPGQLFVHEGNSNADDAGGNHGTQSATPAPNFIASRLPVPDAVRLAPVQAWATQVALEFSPRRVLRKAISESNTLRQYALLRAATHEAVRQGNAAAAVAAEDTITQKFKLNPLSEEVSLVVQLGKTVRRRSQCAILVRTAIKVCAQANAAGDKRKARICQLVAVRAAERSGMPVLVRRADRAYANGPMGLAPAAKGKSPSHYDAIIRP